MTRALIPAFVLCVATALPAAAAPPPFFWIDPQEEIGVIVLMQMLPFYDEAALGVLRGVESRVYQHLQRQAP
jgi:hypothetical protein